MTGEETSDAGTTGSGSGETRVVSSETARKLIVAEVPSVAGKGYRKGKWLWEWHVISCGKRASVGVCGLDVAAVSAAGVSVQGSGDGGGSSGDGGAGGDRADLWVYRSDGHLLHGGESTEKVCPGGGFDSGDVIGVELDADTGTLAFLKNDSYVGWEFKLTNRSYTATGKDGGLYPCVSLRESGDAMVLLGLKEGPAAITYRPPSKIGKKEETGRSPPSTTSFGIQAALFAAVVEATAAAEAVASAVVASVGGGDAVAAGETAATPEGASASSETDAAGASSETDPAGASTRSNSGSQGSGDTAAAAVPDGTAETAAAIESPQAVGGDADASGSGENSSIGTPSSSAAAVVVSDVGGVGDGDSPSPPSPPPPRPPAVAIPTPSPASSSFHPAYFHGEFVRGLKHGPGMLKLNGKGGYWRGKWFQGVQHGVHLLVEQPAKKGQPELDGIPVAWVFDRGVKVCI